MLLNQVPLATTKYCSSTTKYHRVLLQNNFVQQKKVLLQYYSALQSN